MNRSQLFNQSWSIMIRNSSLWIVALIGLGVGTVASLVLSSPSVVMSILNMIISFVVTAFTTCALISMVNSIADGRSVTVSDGIQFGIRRIVPLIFVRLALLLPIWIVLILITGSFLGIFSQFGQPNGIPVANIASLASGIVGTVGVMLVISVITGAINIGADRAVVLENRSVFDALKRGWQVFINNVPDFTVIGVMILIVALAISLLFGCTLGALLSSMVTSQIASGGAFNPTTFTLSAPVLVSALVGLIIGVVMEVLFSGVWTLAFRHWQSKQP
jgi:hypothetical protein